MEIPRLAKVSLGFVAVVALLVYLVIVDLGLNAGRVHHGVEVAGVDLGGLTEIEAIERLEERSNEIRATEIVLGVRGFRRSVTPAQLGWEPDVAETAAAAMEVGRRGGSFEALGARLAAWREGVKVRWAGAPHARRVRTIIDRWEAAAEGHGLVIDRARVRYKFKHALNADEIRNFYRLPLIDEEGS